MLLIRRFEEKAGEMYNQGKIRGFLHLYIGQEAVAVGFISALRPDDYVIGAYREHGQCIMKGCDPSRVMAELFGKSDGVSRGKGGSMHLFDLQHNFLGGTAIVGAGMPLAAGVGLSIKYRGTDQVCMCFFGDGAVNEGAFHEALNLAALWRLPVVFVCENNFYGMGTAVRRASAVQEVASRARCYAIDNDQVDGMDVLACREAAERAIKRARKEQVPVLVEALTYRFRGHSMADPETYRTKEELREWEQRDPIRRLRAQLEDEGALSPGAYEKLEEEVAARVQAAVDFAEASPELPCASMYEDVYADSTGCGRDKVASG